MKRASLDARLAALADAAGLARGRLDEELVDAADAVVRRAGRRLGLGVEATVVALAGPTGAGKSTIFNALAGSELAPASHRRPTTSAATAAVWGDVGDELLDWLEIPRRHRLRGEPDGLVLLDLPDFDSVEFSHRVEVERVVALADLMVWVVDPQKYADGVLHEHYLRPFAAYGEAMLAVLNQADRLDVAGRAACVADLGRLLEADGLEGMPVLAVSALTGEGIGELQTLLEQRVRAREAAAARLSADVASTAAGLAAASGDGASGKVERADRAALTAALSQAAGVPGVVRAVANAHRRRGAIATGWPFVRWLRRLRPDPLRRLRLPDRVEGGKKALPRPQGAGKTPPGGGHERATGASAANATRGARTPPLQGHESATVASAADATRAARTPPGGGRERAQTSAAGANAPGGPSPLDRSAVATIARSSLPAPTRVQRAQVETAARSLAGRAAGNLPDPWPGLIRQAALSHDDELPDRLEAAVSGTDLRMRTPRWWRAAGFLQTLLAILVLAGALWLLALAGLGYLQLDDVIPTPEVEGFPLPTLLLGGGALAGLLLAALAGLAVRAGAKRRARVAEKALSARVRAAGEELVVAPVEAELDAQKRLRQALDIARAGRPAPQSNRSFVTNPAR
jgi:GTP-binding protein EngB required for normal cell division